MFSDWTLFETHSFDYAGFSVWRVDFKYNEELTQVFMSSKQIGGFFIRLEVSRKYLFGSVRVLGTTGDFVISSVWCSYLPRIKRQGRRPHSLKPIVNVAHDWESYTYTKLDVKEDKAFFESALAWDLEVGGKKWNGGKNVSFFCFYNICWLWRFYCPFNFATWTSAIRFYNHSNFTFSFLCSLYRRFLRGACRSSRLNEAGSQAIAPK